MSPSSDTINTTVTTTTVPTISSEFHRRIDVETIDDLRALVDAARRAGQEKIDQCLPRLENKDNDSGNSNNNDIDKNDNTGGTNADRGPDELRVMVEASLRSYINNIYDSVLSNISINGVDADTLYCVDGEGNVIGKNGSTTTDEESYEPFDQSLAANVQTLAEQVEELTADVAAARSIVPAKAAEAFVREYLATEEKEDLSSPLLVTAANAEAATVETEKVGLYDDDDDDDDDDDIDDDIDGFKRSLSSNKMRWDDMQSTWHQAARELVGLNGFADTLARVDRAREVVGEARSVVAG